MASLVDLIEPDGTESDPKCEYRAAQSEGSRRVDSQSAEKALHGGSLRRLDRLAFHRLDAMGPAPRAVSAPRPDAARLRPRRSDRLLLREP
jgi:hypothetical protein